MKKIPSIVLVGILILSGQIIFEADNLLENADGKNIDVKSFTIIETFPNIDEYFFVDIDEAQMIKSQGFNYLLEPGKPMLPVKNILIALPPGAIVESINFEGGKLKQIPGDFNIAPMSKIQPNIKFEQHTNSINKYDEKWQKNYEETYFSDDVYPEKCGIIAEKGTFRKYSYVSVSLYPIRYQPKSGRLYSFESAKIEVNYKFINSDNIEKMKFDTIADKKASEIFINYNEIKKLYDPEGLNIVSQNDNYNYLIITTDELYDEVASSYFLTWKALHGYNIKIVKTNEAEITSQPGFDLAQQIRNFLREYYIDWGVEYVLIVGNYDTVPMRYCYPNDKDHEFNLSDVYSGECPTDYYYADLSYPDEDSWDSDGDGFYGEINDDDIDLFTEVFVGRIPTNDEQRVTYTLDKFVTYESDTADWKNNVLHAGAICLFSPFKDGAAALDFIEKDLMSGMQISHYSEQEGERISTYPWPALTMDSFCNDWRTGKYGIVNWDGHGWSNAASRLVRTSTRDLWKYFIDDTSDIDDNYPSIVFAMSCLVGFPEPCPEEWPPEFTGHLGIDLLTKPSFGAAIAVISGTRLINGGNYRWPNPPGGMESICHEFNNNIIHKNQKFGEALYNAKFDTHTNCPLYGFPELLNMYGYNLYGDPSMVKDGMVDSGRPYKPDTPAGPPSGDVKVEYTYSSSTTDPTNDQVYYLFDWGDNSDSGWLGPYESGETCEARHTWTQKNTYEIKAKAKDIYGIQSEWSDPLVVSMPRNKHYINRPILNFLEQYPNLFSILRQLLLIL
jgi:hypothetical protein